MTYTAQPTASAGDLVTAAMWNLIGTNHAHWASMTSLGTTLGALAASSEITSSGTVTGTYTGDGGSSQAISGIGFQPKVVIVYENSSSAVLTGVFMKTSSDPTTWCVRISNGDIQDDRIRSLDSDGFTVGGTAANEANENTVVYTYKAAA